jgi:hypothetical protein
MFRAATMHAAQLYYTARAKAFIGGLKPLCTGHHKSFFGITPPVKGLKQPQLNETRACTVYA